MTTENRIEIEEQKIKLIFSDLEVSQKKLAEELIKNAAFMVVMLQDLQEQIKTDGPVEIYQNGDNQFGKKQSAALQGYNATLKNYSAIIKQLSAMLPSEVKKEACNTLLGLLKLEEN